VVVNVPVGSFSSTDYAHAAQLIDAGYKAAEQNRAALLRYALDADGWKAYLAARESRRRPQPGVLRQVRVEGGEPGAVREVLADLKPLEGRPIAPATTLDALRNVQSNGGVTATWETFAPAPTSAAPPVSGSSIVGPPVPDTGLLIRLSNSRSGPPYLLISPELAASTSNISRGELSLRFVDQNLGGFGSELRAQPPASATGPISPPNTTGCSLPAVISSSRAPASCARRSTSGSTRSASPIAFSQNLDAGLEAGRTFSNQLQISAEWRAEETHWSLTTGSDGEPYLSGTAQTGLLHINIDKATASGISPNGFRIAASAGALYHAVASSNAPLVKLSFGATRSWNEANIFGVGGEVNSYLRANVAQPYRFTLGGAMRLSASSFDEFRGTDTYLARAGYLHRLAPLPTGLGQGLYGFFGYEAGEVWSPEARAISARTASLAWSPTRPSACSPSASQTATPATARSSLRWDAGSEGVGGSAPGRRADGRDDEGQRRHRG
jgi:NTE family protein